MLAAYLTAALVMAGLDLAWLSQTGDSLYRASLSSVMADKAYVPAAVAFYLLYILGIVYFGVRPGLANGEWRGALLSGALFGFFCYMTYDLTNMATLKMWSWKVAAIDIAWGCTVTGASALSGYFAASAVR
jgi:uncharacterized membrane protein